jgi:hypothetical protein
LPAAFIFETVFQNMKQENVLNYRAHGRELSRAALDRICLRRARDTSLASLSLSRILRMRDTVDF